VAHLGFLGLLEEQESLELKDQLDHWVHREHQDLLEQRELLGL